MRGPNDPFLGALSYVDSLLGPAYLVVKEVQENLAAITAVSEVIGDLGDFATIAEAVVAAQTAETNAETAATTATTKASEASTSASGAATNATTATTKASEASASATTASTGAATATTKASEAATSATNAGNSATAAAASATSASGSATAAGSSQTAAATSATNAAASATSASTSASTATTKASEASTSATSAESSATSASTSASTATTKAGEASTSATAAAASATAALASENAAETAETNAAASASSASTSASTATTKAGEAATSATAAATSATNAGTSETNASNSATAASGSATSAGTSATNAANSATAAASSATAAATSATNAATAETNAETAQAAAEAALDSFDDRYLGSKTSNPSVDNDGGALLTGALYFNTTANEMRVYNGATWVTAYNPAEAAVTSVGLTVPTGLSVANSPVTSAGDIAVTFAAGYSIPTDANQTNWSTAYGWGNHASAGYLTTISGQSVNALNDVTITSLTDGEILISASGIFINQTFAEAGIAPIANPTFTGSPAAPTQTGGTNNTTIATTAFVQAAIAALIDTAPGTLDTLNELAAALGDDPNYAATVTSALAAKLAIADIDDTPVNGETSAPISSNWAFDHAALTTAHGISAFGATLVDDADAAAARTTLGLDIGTNVQAYDADLTTWAGITPGTGVATALAINVGSAGAFVTTNSTDTLTNKTLTAPAINNASITEPARRPIFTITDGASVVLDPANGAVQKWTLTASRTAAAPATWDEGQEIILLVDDGSAFTLNLASVTTTWRTNGGVAPTLNTTGWTEISLVKQDGVIVGARIGNA